MRTARFVASLIAAQPWTARHLFLQPSRPAAPRTVPTTEAPPPPAAATVADDGHRPGSGAAATAAAA